MENKACYQLMYKNEVIVNFNPDRLTDHKIIKKELLPVGMKNGMNREGWLKQRGADKLRTSIRKLFVTLKMNVGNDPICQSLNLDADKYMKVSTWIVTRWKTLLQMEK